MKSCSDCSTLCLLHSKCQCLLICHLLPLVILYTQPPCLHSLSLASSRERMKSLRLRASGWLGVTALPPAFLMLPSQRARLTEGLHSHELLLGSPSSIPPCLQLLWPFDDGDSNWSALHSSTLSPLPQLLAFSPSHGRRDSVPLSSKNSLLTSLESTIYMCLLLSPSLLQGECFWFPLQCKKWAHCLPPPSQLVCEEDLAQ